MDNKEKNNPLGSASVSSLMLKFAIPSIIGMLVSALYNIVDQLFIGQGVGTNGNAATNIAFPFTTACMAVALLLGIGGVSTFGNSRKLKKVIQQVPLDFLVLETDCPYLAPEPHRGERNSSLYLPLVVKAIAEIKGMTEREVEDATWNNAMKLFQLS